MIQEKLTKYITLYFDNNIDLYEVFNLICNILKNRNVDDIEDLLRSGKRAYLQLTEDKKRHEYIEIVLQMLLDSCEIKFLLQEENESTLFQSLGFILNPEKI